MHILVKALILGNPNKKGPITEDAHLEEPILTNPIEEMVQKQSMALDRWFPAAQASGD